MAIILILASFMGSPLASAHPIDLGTLNVKTQEQSLEFQIDISLAVAADLTGLPEQRISQMGRDLAQAFFITTLANSEVQPTQGKCEWQESKARVETDRFKFSITAQCNTIIDEWKLELSFLKRTPPSFELVTTMTDAQNIQQQTTLSARDTVLNHTHQTQHSLGEFLKLGISHIGVGVSEWWSPQGFHWPDGIDHILFVISLVLSSGQIIEILKTVSGFTVGHSITLAFATFQIVNVPGRIIEPAIALSIAFVAGERLFFERFRSHWRIALLFGLIHGLGFATALSDLHLDMRDTVRALVGFNIGVEVGQIVIVALSFPIIYAISKSRLGERYAIPSIAAAIMTAGLYWFVRRAFLI